MSKYIVKNCPAYLNRDNYGYSCGNMLIKDAYCSDCNDCLIKQVIEKCKNTQYLSTRNRQDLYAVKVFANEILQLCEIEECTE